MVKALLELREEIYWINIYNIIEIRSQIQLSILLCQKKMPLINNKIYGSITFIAFLILLMPFQVSTQNATCKGLGNKPEEDLQKLW